MISHVLVPRSVSFSYLPFDPTQVNRTNPHVELWFSDFDGPMGTKRVAPPASFDGEEAHFSRVAWDDAI